MQWPSFAWKRESWRGFWHQRSVIFPLVVTLAALVCSWLLAAATPAITTGEGWAARYSIYVGTNWLTEQWVAFVPPLVATLFAAANVGFGFLLGRRTLTGRRLWLWSAALISLGFLWLSLLLVWFNV